MPNPLKKKETQLLVDSLLRSLTSIVFIDPVGDTATRLVSRVDKPRVVSGHPRMEFLLRTALLCLYSTTENPTFHNLRCLMTDMMTMNPKELKKMFKRAGLGGEGVSKTAEAIANLDKEAFTLLLNRIATLDGTLSEFMRTGSNS